MITPLKQGDPVVHNWRTINQVVAQLNANLVPDQQQSAAIAGLRQRPRDTGIGRLELYRVKSASSDYLICRTWDGVEEGGEDVKIAKPHSARQPASETLAGTVYSYSYSAGPDSLNHLRVSDDGTTTEEQLVTPLWIADGLIQVAQTNFSGVSFEDADLKLIEVSARCWAKIEEPPA